MALQLSMSVCNYDRTAALFDGLAVQVTLGDTTISRGFMRDICVESADRMLGVDLRAAAASTGEAVPA